MKAVVPAALLASLIVTACAHHSSGKPIITKRVVDRLLANCHAAGGQFYPSKKGLPSFSVVSAASNVQVEGRPTATVDCVYRGAQAYRYSYMRLDGEGAVAE